jgi:phage terminase small subunit
MTTLKQQLQEAFQRISTIPYKRQEDAINDAVNGALVIFKLMLEQKLKDAEDNQWNKPKNLDPELNQQWVMKNYKDTLKELLEDLQKQ